MNRIFFKNVRADGSSATVPPPLGVKYEIGGHYHFPEWAPAWCCLPAEWQTLGRAYRESNNGGSRLLICYGQVSVRAVPMLMDTNPVRISHCLMPTSVDFDVIGEVFAPESMRRCDVPYPWFPLPGNVLHVLEEYHATITQPDLRPLASAGSDPA